MCINRSQNNLISLKKSVFQLLIAIRGNSWLVGFMTQCNVVCSILVAKAIKVRLRCDKKISQLGVGNDAKKGVSSAANNIASASLDAAYNSMIDAGKLITSTYDDIQNYRVTHAKQLLDDKTSSNESRININKAFKEMDDLTRSWVEKNGGDERKAVNAVAKIIPVGEVGKDWCDKKSGGRYLSSNEQIQHTEEFWKILDAINRYTQTSSFRGNDNESKVLSDTIDSGLAGAAYHRSEASNSLAESRQWQDVTNYSKTASADWVADLQQDFYSWGVGKGPCGKGLGIDGMSEALGIPKKRQKLINAFLDAHMHSIKNKFMQEKVRK